MAPSRASKPTKTSNKARKPSSLPSSSKSKSNSKSKITRPPPIQQKTRPNLHNPTSQVSNSKPKKKKRIYTDKQLDIPALNAITPANAAASAPNNLNSRGKKRKVFVDDEESMRVILGVVQAAKEGDIESKMVRLRRLEEVREARRVEAEKKEGRKNGEVEKVVERLKKRKRRSGDGKEGGGRGEGEEEVNGELTRGGGERTKKRKKVAFA